MKRTIGTIARRVAMMLLLAVMTNTAQAQNTLVSHIDHCKAGVGSIFIAGWVYDNDKNTKSSWWLGHGIDVFALVSTDPNETYQGYYPIPHDEMEYLVRTDVNDAFGLCNEHGFRTMETGYSHAEGYAQRGTPDNNRRAKARNTKEMTKFI